MYAYEKVLELSPKEFSGSLSELISGTQKDIREAVDADADKKDINELTEEVCNGILKKASEDKPTEKKTSTPTTATKPKVKSAPAKKAPNVPVLCADVNEELARVKAENREVKAENREFKKLATPTQEKAVEKAVEKVSSNKPSKSTKKSTKTAAGKASKAKTPPKKIVVDGKEVPAFSTGYLICRRAAGMDNKTLNRDTVKQFWKGIQDDINAKRLVRASGVEKEVMIVQNVLGMALKNSETKERVKIQFSDGEIAQLRAVKERLQQTVIFMNQYFGVFKDKDRLASWLKRVKKAHDKKEISYNDAQGKKLEKIVDSLNRGDVASVSSNEFLSGLGSLAGIFSAK